MVKNYIFSIGVLSSLFACMYQCEAIDNSSTFRPLPLQQAVAREKPQLLLYYIPWCPYSQKVLDYLKQIHRTVPMKNLQNDFKSKEDLRKVGGKTQVPCLIINGKAMYESAAIIQWLSQNKSILDPN